MAMLTQCFYCKKEIIIPSAEETYKLTDYDCEDLNVFEKYKIDRKVKKVHIYCCKSCFDREILPKIFR